MDGPQNEEDFFQFGYWWMWILGLVVVAVVVLSSLGYIGVFADTVLERKVFENSHQYQETRTSEVSIFEAQMAELEVQLENPELTDSARVNIRSQMAAIRIQINAAKARMK